jgi:uncharacterized protein (UPF0332 family)
MDPADFISLAIRLSNSHNEADLRTAVSRAYYGAFHVVRELLEDCGIYLSGKELFKVEAHQKVRFCLGESGNEDAVVVAKKLGSLRDRRNEADYDLKLNTFSHPTNVAIEMRIAREIVDGVLRCRTEPTFSAFREGVRAYARDVLRIPLAGE